MVNAGCMQSHVCVRDWLTIAGTVSRQSRRRAIHAACHVTCHHCHAYREYDGLASVGVCAQNSGTTRSAYSFTCESR